MTQWPPPDLYVEAKLFGILLSGVLGQTRPECSAETRWRLELPASTIPGVGAPDPHDPKG
jgi:hypothetical protein